LTGLKREGKISLKMFLDACAEEGVEPRKSFSGKFVLRVPPVIHESAALAAAAEGISLNQWVAQVLDKAAHA
jgi:predicted HicB family RNase H-like nuclease